MRLKGGPRKVVQKKYGGRKRGRGVNEVAPRRPPAPRNINLIPATAEEVSRLERRYKEHSEKHLTSLWWEELGRTDGKVMVGKKGGRLRPPARPRSRSVPSPPSSPPSVGEPPSPPAMDVKHSDPPATDVKDPDACPEGKYRVKGFTVKAHTVPEYTVPAHTVKEHKVPERKVKSHCRNYPTRRAPSAPRQRRLARPRRWAPRGRAPRGRAAPRPR